MHECVRIFRCAAMPQRYLVDREIPARKNHFVALCYPTSNLQPGDHYFVPKLPTLPLSAKGTHDQTASTHISHTRIMPKPIVPSMPKKQQFTAAGTKRKQLSLDSLLPKKKISDTQEPHTSNIDVIPPTPDLIQTYRSKTIQNEILEVCGKMITEMLVGEIKDAKFFSILADEATDCANVEQMAVVLRFVDNLLKIREEFLGFILCQKGLSGEALSDKISKFINGIGLSMEDCRGQGYDGAGNMAKKFSGVTARIQRNYEKAI